MLGLEDYLSQKYANILDAEDVEDLFKNMTRVYGSMLKAAEKCGVARTTAYGWQRANYLKSVTKMKVLKAGLEANLIETLKLLTNKSEDRSADLLFTYLSSIYQKAIEVGQTNFQQILEHFLAARHKHYGLIRDTIQNEVTLMVQTLATKAMELQIPFPQDPIENIEPTYLLEIIPDIVTDLAVERVDPIEIVNRYGVPIEVPNTVKEALEPVISISTRSGARFPSVEQWIEYKQLRKATAIRVDYRGKKTSDSGSTDDIKPIALPVVR